jgi:hypothetical protein
MSLSGDDYTFLSRLYDFPRLCGSTGGSAYGHPLGSVSTSLYNLTHQDSRLGAALAKIASLGILVSQPVAGIPYASLLYLFDMLYLGLDFCVGVGDALWVERATLSFEMRVGWLFGFDGSSCSLYG